MKKEIRQPPLLDEFHNLSTEEVAQLVRQAGPKVCVFPTNGTRRWFLLEHDAKQCRDPKFFVDRIAKKHLELYAMFFDHGLDTLLTPIFGPDILQRDDGDITVRAMLLLTQSPFFDFYTQYQVRVRFYGDYRKILGETPYAYLLDRFDEVTQQTLSHSSYRLLYGVCAHDATETVAGIGVRFYQEHGRLPTRREIVEAYYGEYVEPVDLFIGFDRPAAFDMPLVATGNEDLYFTVSPSPYMNAHTLRAILYDHLYTRRVDESSYELLPEDWTRMNTFYQANLDRVIGVGINQGGIWYPVPQVKLPVGFMDE